MTPLRLPLLCFAALLTLAALGLPQAAAQKGQASVILCFDAASPQAAFAAGEIRAAMPTGSAIVAQPLADVAKTAGDTGFILAPADHAAARAQFKAEGGADLPALGPQGFAIRRTTGGGPPRTYVFGADAAGLLYGGLEMAETIRLGRGLTAAGTTAAGPSIARRGVKFNIPLDARTPSYDDSGDSAQANIAEMWDFAFWQAFLDDMARARYNVLTLWNPHPFPSMVRCPAFPEAALDDVCVTTVQPQWKHGSFGEPQGVTPEILGNLRVVRKMTMDEKIAFWRRVMRHARDRGIDVYIITWNVLANSAEGKHGITAAQDNPTTIAYTRESVRQLVLTYPDLAGIGVTAGERMKARTDGFAKEKWLWQAYGLGVLDAKKEQPGRTVRFIHRIWQTSVADVHAEWKAYPDPFDLGFKYAHARLYSSPTPPFARPLCDEMKPLGLRCWWNLRNDDLFVFRWGDPEYVRAFLANLPPAESTAGYYVGSDGYVWGREFASLDPDSPRQLEIRKHWYAFMLWGRLGYDLKMSPAALTRLVAGRFPGVDAPGLVTAWAEASKIVPLVNRFHWRDWDYLWSPEGCIDQRQGFHTVRDFITCRTMESSGLATIPEYVAARAAGRAPAGTTPPQVAEELAFRARVALAGAADLRRKMPAAGKELRETLGDIEAMAHLGQYYAEKILGATALATADKSGRPEDRDAAVRHLEAAVKHWQAYAAAATRQYKPQLLARTRDLDWMKILEDVKKDVELARAKP